MNRTGLFPSLSLVLLVALAPAGCSTFSTQNAREVSRERLLEISEKGKCDHLRYVGSDFAYHYVYDSRPSVEKTYKVRADSIKLADTFPPGSDDSYVLHPWLIEGKRFGTKPKFELDPYESPHVDADARPASADE